MLDAIDWRVRLRDCGSDIGCEVLSGRDTLVPVNSSSLETLVSTLRCLNPFPTGCVLLALIALSACEPQKKVDQSLASAVAQGVVRAVPTKFQTQNLLGQFSVTVDGQMAGDHWDAHGRRYRPQLVLMCSGRASSARLRWAIAIGSTDPLPRKELLQASVILGSGAARRMTLTRTPGGSHIIEGALPLVHEILHAPSMSISTITADRVPLQATFDLRGIQDAIRKFDFFCASAWLEQSAPRPTMATRDNAMPRRAPPVQGDAMMRLEAVRSSVRQLEGVTSTVWLQDRTLMIGMGNATADQMAVAVRDACELLRGHPEVSHRIEVQDTRGSTGSARRLDCPR